MRSIVFTESIVEAIDRDRFEHYHPRNQRKFWVLWLEYKGKTREEIADLVGVSVRTVQRYIDEFIDGGLESISEIPFHCPESALAPFETTLKKHFLDNPPRSAREARETIERLTGIKRCEAQVRNFLKKNLGLRPVKVGIIPGKIDEAKRKEQREFHETELKPRLKEAQAGKRAILFGDAAHFLFAPYLGYLWCLVRQFISSPAGRKRFSILAAINPITHQIFSVETVATVNAQTVCDLLDLIAKAYVGIPITLVLDNARYQRSRLAIARAKELNIELLFLPSYSPNLNLIERLWRLVKKDCLACRYFGSFDDFCSEMKKFVIGVDKGKLKTLITLNFQFFDDVAPIAA